MNTIKFWAFFESTSSYLLMSHAQYIEQAKSKLPKPHRFDALLAFETLKDAKDYLLLNFSEETAEARQNINDIREWNAKDNQ